MYKVSKKESLWGDITVPSDKSISHRAVMFASLSTGKCTVYNLLEGEDVLHTIDAFKQLGVSIEKQENNYVINSKGINNFTEPNNVLYLGNSGTTARLILGILANLNFNVCLTGDSSLCDRPMKRVIEPLQLRGVQIISRSSQRLPLIVNNENRLKLESLKYELPIASAQVKSALLLSGLLCEGDTVILEPIPTRAYTEQFLQLTGANLITEELSNGGYVHKLQGLRNNQTLSMPLEFFVPADPSSAAFLCVAALILPNSRITLKQVDVSETRIGLYKSLIKMGAHIKFENYRITSGIKVADILVESSQLKGCDILSSEIPSQIDEIPILSVAAAIAQGETNIYGLSELKVKESNRLLAIHDMLNASGIQAKIGVNDSLHIKGLDKSKKIHGNAVIHTNLDHRIAMSAYVLGMVSECDIIIDDIKPVSTSFPNFFELFEKYVN